MANSKKRKRIIIIGIAGVLLVLGVGALRKKDPVITIQAEKVARRDLIERVIATGKIQPVTQVVISPEVAGEITALPLKEGDRVKKGDLLVQIKPENYRASRNSAEANYRSATAAKNLAQAQLDKAEKEYKRNKDLFDSKLVSESIYLDFQTGFEVAKLQHESALHQEEQAKFGLDKAIEDLSKTTILAPIDGTVTRLKSQLGERVLGTSFNMGTEIMTVADLSEMEARVDIGEVDVVLIAPGQTARLEVDAFKNRKFAGVVTEIANSAKGLGSSLQGMGGGGGGSGQDATKFEVHIRVKEKETFLPGMSVTADIETRYRTNVLTVPIASLTTRLPKGTNASGVSGTNTAAPADPPAGAADSAKPEKKSKETKPIEVVFVLDGDHVKMIPVKSGISDDDYYEVTQGLQEGQEIVSGGFKAINRDLEDGKKVVKGAPNFVPDKKEP